VTGLLRNFVVRSFIVVALTTVWTPLRAHGSEPDRPKSTIRLVGDEEPTGPRRNTQPLNVLPPQHDGELPQPITNTELPQSPVSQPQDPQSTDLPPMGNAPSSLDDYSTEQGGQEPELHSNSESFFDRLKWLGLRHYSTDGRNAGMGIPLVGTSWLNRPYYLGIDLGTVWITDSVQPDVTRDTDMYGGIYAGCDWDYYWGTEFDIQRATPELINEHVPNAPRGDRMMIYTANMMYYPWGDSYYRPYWRLGIGEMDVDYPMDNGQRRDESLWNFPIGIGIKYPVRRWLAARAEITDELGLGNSGVATQHDITLTFALEWRFGAHPRSYWPWNPSRHIW